MVVGLGNPGSEYAGTRHNAGFLVVDRILTRRRVSADTATHKYDALVYALRYASRPLVLVKPLTFMNRSGPATTAVLRAYELDPEQLLVVYDCLDLDVGRIRVRRSGASGGHKGVQSVIDTLGTESFARVRVGIGRAKDRDPVEYVLSPWPETERETMDRVLAAAADAVLLAVRRGVDAAMNRYNGWEAGVTGQRPAAEEKTT